MVLDRSTFGSACHYIGYLVSGSDSLEDVRVRPFVERKINGYTYYKTTLMYQDTINERIGNVFTDEALNRFVSGRYMDVGGVLYCSETGGGSGVSIANLKVTLLSQNSNSGTYTYKATFAEGGTNSSSQFTIKRVGDDFRISAIDSLTGNDF